MSACIPDFSAFSTTHLRNDQTSDRYASNSISPEATGNVCELMYHLRPWHLLEPAIIRQPVQYLDDVTTVRMDPNRWHCVSSYRNVVSGSLLDNSTEGSVHLGTVCQKHRSQRHDTERLIKDSRCVADWTGPSGKLRTSSKELPAVT